MILLWGDPGDRPFGAVLRELTRGGAPCLVLTPAEAAGAECRLVPGEAAAGELCLGAVHHALAEVRAAYLRPPAPAAATPAERRQEAQLAQALLTWADVTPACVVNRPAAMAANQSKPSQAGLIRAAGFATRGHGAQRRRHAAAPAAKGETCRLQGASLWQTNSAKEGLGSLKVVPSLLTLLLVLLLLSPAAAAGGTPRFSDLAGHWAEGMIVQAATEGWVNGYPDGRFDPEHTVTRAEFVKMLAAATGLTPGSTTARTLAEASVPFTPQAPESVLTDTQGHWFAAQGWLKSAVSFGLVVPDDYAGGRFEPDRPISRQEIAIMAVRALGLVAAAGAGDAAAPGFTDWGQVPAWAQGYVSQAVAAGVLKGFPDGRFAGDQPATRAQAVVMVGRALSRMATGADTDIKVFVRVQKDQPPYAVDLPVPAGLEDGHLYVPASAVTHALFLLRYVLPYGRDPAQLPLAQFRWDPGRQRFFLGPVTFTAGSDAATLDTGNNQAQPLHLEAPARIVRGELMLPVHMSDGAGSPFFQSGSVAWDPGTKVLVIEATADYQGQGPS